MSREAYKEQRFTNASLKLIAVMDDIITDYQGQGYVLTVRQLYYQLVAKALIPNTERSYKSITSLVNDARLAGLLDWAGIEDRTRAFVTRSRWATPSDILHSAASSYHEDLWAQQEHRVFVIVEKEALAGVLEAACDTLDVPLLAARGYPSGTVLREFVEGVVNPSLNNGQRIVILHFGDHDPSGIDMTRDLRERLALFSYGGDIELTRVALNMLQIEEINPPENPAKTSDARFESYRRLYGDSSWELDALSPAYLTGLVKVNVEQYIDRSKWRASMEAIQHAKDKLNDLAENWSN